MSCVLENTFDMILVHPREHSRDQVESFEGTNVFRNVNGSAGDLARGIRHKNTFDLTVEVRKIVVVDIRKTHIVPFSQFR